MEHIQDLVIILLIALPLLDMLLELTGYVYLDIESFIDISNEDMREELFSHKFIVGVWLSFGGKGFGALAYCPELIFHQRIDKKAENFSAFLLLIFLVK